MLLRECLFVREWGKIVQHFVYIFLLGTEPEFQFILPDNFFSEQKRLLSLRRHFHFVDDPKSWNDGTAERWNGEMEEWRKMTLNSKTWNGGKCPQILKHGMAENDPKS